MLSYLKYVGDLMKRNNKGFMLVEVIVTSTIVVTTMILLYSSFNKLSNNYKTKNSYYNLDATYATKEMINSILKSYDEDIYDEDINEFINNTFYNNRYGYIIKKEGNVINCKISNISCDNLKKLYSIENMIFSEYDSESLDNLKNNESINQTFREYIEYLIKYYSIKDIEHDYSYIILTEVNENGNYYYASLRMR